MCYNRWDKVNLNFTSFESRVVCCSTLELNDNTKSISTVHYNIKRSMFNVTVYVFVHDPSITTLIDDNPQFAGPLSVTEVGDVCVITQKWQWKTNQKLTWHAKNTHLIKAEINSLQKKPFIVKSLTPSSLKL